MTMRERNGPGGETIQQTIQYEVYLRGREEPISLNVSFELRKELFEEGQELDNLMQMATQHLLGTIDVVREHRWILSDEKFNKFVILADELQAVSILAPEEKTLMEALEQ